MKTLNRAQLLSLFTMYVQHKNNENHDGISINNIWREFEFNSPHICRAFSILTSMGLIKLKKKEGREKKYVISNKGLVFIEKSFGSVGR